MVAKVPFHQAVPIQWCFNHCQLLLAFVWRIQLETLNSTNIQPISRDRLHHSIASTPHSCPSSSMRLSQGQYLNHISLHELVGHWQPSSDLITQRLSGSQHRGTVIPSHGWFWYIGNWRHVQYEGDVFDATRPDSVSFCFEWCRCLVDRRVHQSE